VGIRISGVCIDTNDVARATAFWSALTGFKVEEAADGHASLAAPDGTGPGLFVQLVPEPPAGKNRLHLDLETSDVAAEVDRAIELGATEVTSFVGHADGGWVVLADTDGNQFCICPE
jgi:predicted enzyme related to lactoylglutathione lyase